MGIDSINSMIKSGEAREAELREECDTLEEQHNTERKIRDSIWEQRYFLRRMLRIKKNKVSQEEYSKLSAEYNSTNNDYWDEVFACTALGNREFSAHGSLLRTVFDNGKLKQIQAMNKYMTSVFSA